MNKAIKIRNIGVVAFVITLFLVPSATTVSADDPDWEWEPPDWLPEDPFPFNSTAFVTGAYMPYPFPTGDLELMGFVAWIPGVWDGNFHYNSGFGTVKVWFKQGGDPVVFANMEQWNCTWDNETDSGLGLGFVPVLFPFPIKKIQLIDVKVYADGEYVRTINRIIPFWFNAVPVAAPASVTSSSSNAVPVPC